MKTILFARLPVAESAGAFSAVTGFMIPVSTWPDGAAAPKEGQ